MREVQILTIHRLRRRDFITVVTACTNAEDYKETYDENFSHSDISILLMITELDVM